jgi:hypothetical protein
MKAKLTLLAFSFLFVHLLLASAWEEDGKFKRLYIGISASGNVTYRYLRSGIVPAGSSSSQVQDVIGTRNKYEYPGFGGAGGLKVGVRLTHWLAIESGALVTYQWYQFKTNLATSGLVYTPTPAPTDSFVSKEKNKYVYFNIPLALNFTMGKHRVKGIISAGTTFDFLLSQRISYVYTYNTGATHAGVINNNYNNFKTFNLSPFLGIGIDCYLSRAVVLRIMPYAQMQAFKNIDQPVTEYLYSGGLNVSLLLGFLNSK